ncbi:hypothetical protein NUU61_002776, partial [Penicillium alfredii]
HLLIYLGSICFVKELLYQELPIAPLYVYEAINANAKDVLVTLFENGWDINKPMGSMHPPILSNTLDNIEMTT